MTFPERLIAVLSGLALLLLAVVLALREAVLASGPDVVWALPSWLSRLNTGPSPATTAAAAVLGVLAVVLLVLAWRQVAARTHGPQIVHFPGDGVEAHIDVGGLEAALARSLERSLVGARVAAVQMSKPGGGWRVRVELLLSPDDLLGARARASAIVSRDLAAVGGIKVARVDLVVTGPAFS